MYVTKLNSGLITQSIDDEGYSSDGKWKKHAHIINDVNICEAFNRILFGFLERFLPVCLYLCFMNKTYHKNPDNYKA